MGLEKVVLDKLEEVDVSVADNAEFRYGTLFIANSSGVSTYDIYHALNALKDVVNCGLQTSRVGNEIAIDFVSGEWGIK